MAKTTSAPGIHAAGIAAQSDAAVFNLSLQWLSRKETHDWDPGHERSVKEFEWLTRIGAHDILNEGRVPTATLRGYVDDVDFPLMLEAAIAVKAPVVFETIASTQKMIMGGDMAAALPMLSVGIIAGELDAGSTPKVIYGYGLKSCRVRQLIIYLDDTSGRLRYECTVVGIWNDQMAFLLADVVPTLGTTTFTKNQIRAGVVTRPLSGTPTWPGGYVLKALNSFRLTINNENDPHYTTSTGSAITASSPADYTDPQDFDEGNAAVTVELAYWSKYDNSQMWDDYRSSAEKSWRIEITKATNKAYNFYLPRVGYVPAKLEAATRKQPIQRATGIALYDPIQLTNMLAYYKMS